MAERIRTLWAVTDGAYSDYRVIAVFEREQDAKAAEKAGLGDDVSEMPYCAAGVMPRKVIQHEVRATAYRNGKLGDVAVHTFSEPAWHLNVNPAPRRPRIDERRVKPGQGYNVKQETVYLTAVCSSLALAEKAIRDRLARIYAEWEGIADA